jgi:hypothetical protein
MSTNESKLGWALAHLESEQLSQSTQLNETDRCYLDQLVQRLDDLKKNGRVATVLTKIPAQSCLHNHPFLENNDDFFIAFFTSSKQENACINLFKHLNDCFHCFEIFSQVLRDYYHSNEQLRENREDHHNG